MPFWMIVHAPGLALTSRQTATGKGVKFLRVIMSNLNTLLYSVAACPTLWNGICYHISARGRGLVFHSLLKVSQFLPLVFNRPYSYSQYWTGTSLKWRLMPWYIKNYLHLKRFRRISLHCKLAPFQYWEYEYGLFRTIPFSFHSTALVCNSAIVQRSYLPLSHQWFVGSLNGPINKYFISRPLSHIESKQCWYFFSRFWWLNP